MAITVTRCRALGVLALLAGLGGAVPPAAAHDEAKTPISPSIFLRQTAPEPSSDPSRAFDQSLREPGPPPARKPLEPEIMPDGSIRYGNTLVIHQHCPPGSPYFEPPPLPGRRRR